MRVFITGDFHGTYNGLLRFCKVAETTRDDILICLGDFGANYDNGENDTNTKTYLTGLPITFVIIHGNHEMRPSKVLGYTRINMFGGMGWIDYNYPNQYFLDDGEFNINGKKVLALGGAYSVDKEYRLRNGKRWFSDEQMDAKVMKKMICLTNGKKYDYVISHTCPRTFEPIDSFLPGIDQSRVDKTMENFLKVIYDQIEYKDWYVGHWHTDRVLDGITFMFHDYKQIE